MIYIIGILWCASLVGMTAALLYGQLIGAFTMFMNLVLATIMIVERID